MNLSSSHDDLITTIKGGLAVTTTHTGVHVRTTLARASSVASPAKSAVGRVVKASAAVKGCITSGAAPARPTASKQQGATAMPFARLMGGFRAPATAAQPTPVKTMHFPEMVGGIATGRRVEVHVPSSATTRIDAAATAKKILAAGARARGGK